MTVAVIERNRIDELAEIEEIKELRKHYREESESAFTERGLLSLAGLLSFLCGKNVFVGQDAAVYFEILDTRDFLLEKYAELPREEAAKYKDKIDSYLKEANEELEFLKGEILRK